MKLVEDKKISMNRGAWMRFDEESTICHNNCIPTTRFDPCSNLFSMIPINPYGEVFFACCGLPCETYSIFKIRTF